MIEPTNAELNAWRNIYPQEEEYGQAEVEETWPEPITLDRVAIPATLAVRLIPECLARVIGRVAEAIQVPVELPWGVAMSVLSTAIGRRAKVQLPNHAEACPIWTCSVLEPGSRKSAVFEVLTRPLLNREAELERTWREHWRKWKAESEIAEAIIQKLRQAAKKAGSDREELAQEIEEEKKILEAEPMKPLLFVTDTTTESLRKDLAAHGSLGLLSAEGAGLLESFGRYNGSKGVDLALWLASFSGDADKGSRVSGTHGVREALATVGGTIQLDVLQSIGQDRMARRRGLLDRLIFLVPEDPRGTRDYAKAVKLSESIMRPWESIVFSILDLEPAAKDAEIPTVALEPAADKVWTDFAQCIEHRQSPGGDLRAMSGFASKLAGKVGRIAMAYHLAQGKGTEDLISEGTLLQAVGTGVLLIQHQRAALALIGETEEQVRAKLVLECLKKHRPETVKPWEVVHKHWGGCQDVDQARAVLNILTDHLYCRLVVVDRNGKVGAPPKELYEMNPRVYQ